jgi:ABC-type lipoprotein release transport system permease subunit
MSEEERKFIIASLAIGVVGLLLGIAGAFYSLSEVNHEFGCENGEFLQDKYGEVSGNIIQECLEDHESAKKLATFLTNISLPLILFAILLLFGANKLKKTPPSM